MEVLSTQDAASVILFDLQLSESELQYITIALEYMLQKLNAEELREVFDEGDTNIDPIKTREFLEGMLESSKLAVRTYCRPEYLPARFKA